MMSDYVIVVFSATKKNIYYGYSLLIPFKTHVIMIIWATTY